MRIAQVSPLFESVPPRLYGGTERIVSYLTEELVWQGHDVTLFASGDSESSARLVAGCPEALRLGTRPGADGLAHHVRLVELVFRELHAFDVIHFHIDCVHFPLLQRVRAPAVTTLHGRLDLDEISACFWEYRSLPFASISESQRAPMPWLNWSGTVHHGLPPDLYRPSLNTDGYLAFVGRVSPEKRVDRAIEIATRAGMPLRIAAKVDPGDRDYFEACIRPLLSLPGIEFVGEIGERDKAAFFGRAAALLFPIDWPEPFGLVMIEAMACGTPVIAFPHGSVPEVIEDGVTGFLVGSVDEAVRAVSRLPELSRERCRREFERRFTARRMAQDYLAIYRELVEAGDVHDGKQWAAGGSAAGGSAAGDSRAAVGPSGL